MTKLFCVAILTALSATTIAANTLYETFSTESRIAAVYPYPYVENKIYSTRVKSYGQKSLPIKRCVLFHGFGISQGLIEYVIRKQGVGANVVRLGLLASGKGPVHVIAESYFGGDEVINYLRKNVCEEIVFTVQESTQSSLWEMTQRSERFLAQNHICNFDRRDLMKDQKACAIVGHSKGGAMVSLMLLRCKDRSAHSEAVCRNLDEVYSSAAANGGLAISALLAGLRVTSQEQLAEDYFSDLFSMTRVAPKWNENGDEPNLAIGTFYDLFSDVVAKRTNPVWYDMSPLAIVDGNMTIGERFVGANAQAGGWFSGDYAASGTLFDFRGPGKPGSGTPLQPDVSDWIALEQQGRDANSSLGRAIGDIAGAIRRGREQETIFDLSMKQMATKFSEASLRLHESKLKPAFDAGVQSLRDYALAKSLDSRAIKRFSWDLYQYGDGIADAFASLSMCYATHQDITIRPIECRAWQDTDENRTLNHYAIAGFDRHAAAHLFDRLEQ